MASEPCQNCGDARCEREATMAKKPTPTLGRRVWTGLLCERRAKERALAEVARLTAELAEARTLRWVPDSDGRQRGWALVVDGVWRATVLGCEWWLTDRMSDAAYAATEADAKAAAEAALGGEP